MNVILKKLTEGCQSSTVYRRPHRQVKAPVWVDHGCAGALKFVHFKDAYSSDEQDYLTLILVMERQAFLSIKQ